MALDRTILLVDDNAVQAGIRQTILRRAGYYVFTALNPVRALEQMKENTLPADVNLVITDHVMPGMSGTQFVSELRRFQPKLPILVISGMEEASDLYDGLDVEFRVKPLPPDHLLDCVRNLLLEGTSAKPLSNTPSVEQAFPVAR
ncbi:MAG: response regulator [Edaphobacter sp.]|uniref:response regulator n=1 Tax=Edaphobacter sp. TaxID=1934404 RepID=UPI0023A5AF8B|nr:response regulator [Edaphobacter sp.]MDE1175112.1 response regulator [Edaphobacter sp.]